MIVMAVCNVTKGIKLTVFAILNGMRFFDTNHSEIEILKLIFWSSFLKKYGR